MHNINHYLAKYNEKKVDQFKQGEPTKEHEAMKLKLESVKANQEKALAE